MRARSSDFLIGSAVGFLSGLVIKELDLVTLVSLSGQRAPLVVIAALVGGLAWLTPLRKLVGFVGVTLGSLWLVVAFTPLTYWMARDLPRRDVLEKGDAVFVLASSLQEDGDFTTSSLSRLVGGLELLGGGWAPVLILSELPAPRPKYEDAAQRLMAGLGLEREILVVGPVRNTHEEAVAVSKLCHERGFQRILMVTSPAHSRRAAAALEAQGVTVTSFPSQQIHFDFEGLNNPFRSDGRVRAFGRLAHERVGLLYYRFRGWIS